MTNEHSNRILSEYPGNDYVKADAELGEVARQIDLVGEHYDEEISAHEEVSQIVSPGEEYPFVNEHEILVNSRNAELTPLTQKQLELTAKLRRLYAVAWNEAIKKENRDKRYQEHQEALPAVREMHEEIQHMYTEINAVNERAVRIVGEAGALAQSLEVLLSKEKPTDEDEKEIRKLMETLVEVYAKITNMEHRIVHSGVFAPGD